MPLKFNGAWRFNPPADGQYVTEKIPDRALSDFIDLIMTVSEQGDDRQDVLEHFKAHFCRAGGSTHMRSSDVGWAKTDLWRDAQAAAKNAPRFIEGFLDACRSFAVLGEDRFAPDEAMINGILAKHNIGYEIRGERLAHRGHEAPLVRVAPPPPTLAEQAADVLQTSLNRAEELLQQGKSREAVQESLWLLETIATAFRGLETGTGTIEGKYFNQIAKDLRAANRGATLERVLEWATAVHGYLSSPTGGGVRHGLDLNDGVPVGDNEARLFCNLIRSFIAFLLTEHERLARRR